VTCHWAALTAGILLCVSGSASVAAEENRQDERQAICQGHEHGRSWNHFLETTCLADVVLRGVVKTQKGYRVLLELSATKTTFTAEVGTLLYDGIVVAIDDRTVTIRQTIGVPARAWQASGAAEKQTRLITRSLDGDSQKQKPH
jgi:hypothetical protein